MRGWGEGLIIMKLTENFNNYNISDEFIFGQNLILSDRLSFPCVQNIAFDLVTGRAPAVLIL